MSSVARPRSKSTNADINANANASISGARPGAGKDARRSPWRPCLYVAAEEGYCEWARHLLACGGDPHQRRHNGVVPLYSASLGGHLGLATLLLDHGASPNTATFNKNVTPLYVALEQNHLDVARLLLARGADPNVARSDNGATPLHVLASQKVTPDGAAARLLLARGAEPDRPTTNTGATPLHYACMKGHVDLVRLLLDHGADPRRATASTSSWTPLLLACQHGHIGVARLLLRRHADPNQAVAGTHHTPLFIAAGTGHTELAGLLATFGAAVRGPVAIADAAGSGEITDPRCCALASGHDELATWLDVVADWRPIQIAVACRLHSAAREALRTGAIGDPTACALADVKAAAAGGSLGRGLPASPMCRATQRLAADAMACWSPPRHWLHHKRFREAVHTVMLVRQRLDRQGHAPPRGTAVGCPLLPPEMWLCVCAWLLRRHWAVVCHGNTFVE